MDSTNLTNENNYDRKELKNYIKLTVEEILNEDIFVEDLKNYSNSFLNRIVNIEIVKKMISYIINEFTEDSLAKVILEKMSKNPDLRVESFHDVYFNLYSKKFPYNASEILSADNSSILDLFFENSKICNNIQEIQLNNSPSFSNENEKNYELLDYFFSFLNTEKELNIILSGYFLKVFNRIFNSKNEQLMEYIYQRKEIINNLFKHINTKPICDILSRIMTSKIIENSYRNEILLKLLDSMNSNNIDTIFSLSSLLEDIFQNLLMIDIILGNLTIFEKIHNVLLNIETQTTNYLEFFRNLIKFYEIIADQPKYKSFELSIFHIEIIERTLKNIQSNFMKNVHTNLQSTYNKSTPVFGLKRLYGFQFIIRIMKLTMNSTQNNKSHMNSLLEIILNSDFFEKTIDYLFEYQWNNLYQNEFSLFICEMTSNRFPKDLTENLFNSSKIINKLINSILENGFFYNSGRKINSGFIPIVFQILDHLNGCNNIMITKLLKKNEKWDLFEKSILHPYSEKIKKGLLTQSLTGFQDLKIKPASVLPITQTKKIKRLFRIKDIILIMIGILICYFIA